MRSLTGICVSGLPGYGKTSGDQEHAAMPGRHQSA
jgi:hypothetical protein